MLGRAEKAKVQYAKLQTRLAKLEEAIYKKQQLIEKLENGNVEARREALDAQKEKYIDNLVHPASGKRVAELEAEVAELAAASAPDLRSNKSESGRPVFSVARLTFTDG